jgi:hypothetical protein
MEHQAKLGRRAERKRKRSEQNGAAAGTVDTKPPCDSGQADKITPCDQCLTRKKKLAELTAAINNWDEKLAEANDKIEELQVELAEANDKIEELQKAAPVCVACASKTPMCLICLVERADIACDPCGHLCYCQNCKKVSNCLQCRQPTDKYLRIYIQSP